MIWNLIRNSNYLTGFELNFFFLSCVIIRYRVESRIADAMTKNRTLIKVGLKFQFNEPESRAAKALIANIDKRRVDRVREEGPGQNVKWKVPKTID